jgi:hypothetical protein
LLFFFSLLLDGEWVAHVVVRLWVVWLRLIWVEAFSDFFLFAFAGVSVTKQRVSGVYETR